MVSDKAIVKKITPAYGVHEDGLEVQTFYCQKGVSKVAADCHRVKGQASKKYVYGV